MAVCGIVVDVISQQRAHSETRGRDKLYRNSFTRCSGMEPRPCIQPGQCPPPLARLTTAIFDGTRFTIFVFWLDEIRESGIRARDLSLGQSQLGSVAGGTHLQTARKPYTSTAPLLLLPAMPPATA